MPSPRLAALALFAIVSACSGSEDPFADRDGPVPTDTGNEAGVDAGVPLPTLGADCASDGDCDSGRCETIAGRSTCVSPCTEDADCLGGWSCEPYPVINARICECERPVDERANGEDDDCDGAVDEGFVRLAFWNVRQLSIASRDETELSLIADVLETYDLVALAEVADASVVGELEDILDARGLGWGSYTSDAVGNSAASAERYGLVWREDAFRITETRTLDEIETPDGTPFGREPLLATGRSVAGGFDFAMLVVHVVWGDGEEERIQEVRALAEYVEEARQSDLDVILAGDLNRNADDPDGIAWLELEASIVTTTESTPPTKVDSANTYDHLFVDPVATTEYTGSHGVDLFDRFYFPGDPDGAERAMSDHRPVWIAIDVRAADDD